MELRPSCFLSLLFRSSASSISALGEVRSDLFLHLLVEPPWLFGHALQSEPNVLDSTILQMIQCAWSMIASVLQEGNRGGSARGLVTQL